VGVWIVYCEKASITKGLYIIFSWTNPCNPFVNKSSGPCHLNNSIVF
jgi:hypothetical protein